MRRLNRWECMDYLVKLGKFTVGLAKEKKSWRFLRFARKCFDYYAFIRDNRYIPGCCEIYQRGAYLDSRYSTFADEFKRIEQIVGYTYARISEQVTKAVVQGLIKAVRDLRG